MSFDLYSFGDLPFFSDPSFPFSHTDVVAQQNSNPLLFDESLPSSSSLDPFSPSFISFSPPRENNLTLYHHQANLIVQQQPLSNGPNLASEFGSFSAAFDGSEVKSEESKIYNQQQFLPHSYSGAENVSKYNIQRSFSSNSFERKPGFLFQQPHHDTALLDSPQFHQRNDISSPENSGQMRRVCSTGDLQNMKLNHMSPTEGQLLEEAANFKVGRYSAEERKERISKYRAKRTQRNFNKTIKYACRKTLADNRPRIRGRFARNDEPNEIPKAACSNRDEDEFDFWMEELQLREEQEDVTVGVGAEKYVKSYGASQFQYCGF